MSTDEPRASRQISARKDVVRTAGLQPTQANGSIFQECGTSPPGLGGRNVWTSCLDAHEGPAGGQLTREPGSCFHQLLQVAADICCSDRGVKEQKLLTCWPVSLRV